MKKELYKGLFFLATVFMATVGAYQYGKIVGEAGKLAPELSEKVNLGFLMQSMDFMLDASQANATGNANISNQKILLLLADSLFFLTNALDAPSGKERLKDGLCKRLPRLVAYSDLLNAGKISLAALSSDSTEYVKSTIANATTNFQALCARNKQKEQTGTDSD